MNFFDLRRPLTVSPVVTKMVAMLEAGDYVQDAYSTGYLGCDIRFPHMAQYDRVLYPVMSLCLTMKKHDEPGRAYYIGRTRLAFNEKEYQLVSLYFDNKRKAEHEAEVARVLAYTVIKREGKQ